MQKNGHPYQRKEKGEAKDQRGVWVVTEVRRFAEKHLYLRRAWETLERAKRSRNRESSWREETEKLNLAIGSLDKEFESWIRNT